MFGCYSFQEVRVFPSRRCTNGLPNGRTIKVNGCLDVAFTSTIEISTSGTSEFPTPSVPGDTETASTKATVRAMTSMTSHTLSTVTTETAVSVETLESTRLSVLIVTEENSGKTVKSKSTTIKIESVIENSNVKGPTNNFRPSSESKFETTTGSNIETNENTGNHKVNEKRGTNIIVVYAVVGGFGGLAGTIITCTVLIVVIKKRNAQNRQTNLNVSWQTPEPIVNRNENFASGSSTPLIGNANATLPRNVTVRTDVDLTSRTLRSLRNREECDRVPLISPVDANVPHASTTMHGLVSRPGIHYNPAFEPRRGRYCNMVNMENESETTDETSFSEIPLE